MAGSNCIGPSAPAPLAPEWTPGRFEVPFPDSTVPMAASTVQGRPGQVAAAAWYNESISAGMALLAAALTPMARPAADVPPTPPPPVPTGQRRTDHPGCRRHEDGGEHRAAAPRAEDATGDAGKQEHRMPGERSVRWARGARTLDILGP